MIRVIILAAGKGKRMGSEEMPKVLRPLAGKSLLGHVLDAVENSGVGKKPIAVVGYKADMVRERFGDACEYAVQESLRGTGDAVRSAKGAAGDAEHVIVLNGDMPLVSGAGIRRIADMHLATGATMTFGTVRLESFDGWKSMFTDFGRVIRGNDGEVERIVEARDATPEELESKEVNPGIFCFRTSWLWKEVETLTTENAQGEYYITDLLAKAIQDGESVKTVPVKPEEAVGVNTPEQLKLAESLLGKAGT